MIKLKQLSLLIIAFICLFTSCRDSVKRRMKVNVPVYMSYEKLRAPETISTDIIEPLVNTGKIYFKDNYIFINDKYEGIHIIDNMDPANPQNISYITIPGNTDISIKGNLLYANSFVDLVVIDISNIENAIEVGRLEDAFPYDYPMIENEYGAYGVDDEKGLIVGWELEEMAIEEEEIYYSNTVDVMMTDDAVMEASADVKSGAANVSTGVGGSMAAFKLYDSYLYTIHQSSNIKVFDITDGLNPAEGESVYVTWGIETLFIKENKLFIGAQDGMYIYSLVDAHLPSYISQFSHIRSCDPVVVEGDYAYVTLRGGSSCGGFENQLDVIDISNINAPELIKTYTMHNPHGLGIDSTTLFICDGDEGLKIFDASDPLKVTDNQLNHFEDIDAFDVIPLGGHLLLIGEDGLHQYDYRDKTAIFLLSTLNMD